MKLRETRASSAPGPRSSALISVVASCSPARHEHRLRHQDLRRSGRRSRARPGGSAARTSASGTISASGALAMRHSPSSSTVIGNVQRVAGRRGSGPRQAPRASSRSASLSVTDDAGACPSGSEASRVRDRARARGSTRPRRRAVRNLRATVVSIGVAVIASRKPLTIVGRRVPGCGGLGGRCRAGRRRGRVAARSWSRRPARRPASARSRWRSRPGDDQPPPARRRHVGRRTGSCGSWTGSSASVGHQRQRALPQHRAGPAGQGEPELRAAAGRPQACSQPPCRWVSSSEIDSPSPVPPLVRARAGSARQNRLKTSAASPGRQPRRRSRVRRSRPRGRRRPRGPRCHRDSAWSMALVTRLRTIRSTRRTSASARQGVGERPHDHRVPRAARRAPRVMSTTR